MKSGDNQLYLHYFMPADTKEVREKVARRILRVNFHKSLNISFLQVFSPAHYYHWTVYGYVSDLFIINLQGSWFCYPFTSTLAEAGEGDLLMLNSTFKQNFAHIWQIFHSENAPRDKSFMYSDSIMKNNKFWRFNRSYLVDIP